MAKATTSKTPTPKTANSPDRAGEAPEGYRELLDGLETLRGCILANNALLRQLIDAVNGRSVSSKDLLP